MKIEGSVPTSRTPRRSPGHARARSGYEARLIDFTPGDGRGPSRSGAGRHLPSVSRSRPRAAAGVGGYLSAAAHTGRSGRRSRSVAGRSRRRAGRLLPAKSYCPHGRVRLTVRREAMVPGAP
jgi:hypothetical protein